VNFFGHLFSFFRRKSLPEHIEDQLEERRLRPRVNPREGTRVLVIDDSPTILTAMKRFLESAHCIFLGALDAKMGMEVALTQKPDMIFLDIVMPGINGFAALRALRKNSRTREIPIIMMSGNEQAKAQFFGAHIGADDFMKKPFSRFEVFARLARLLDSERIPRRPSAPGAAVQNTQPTAASDSGEAEPPKEQEQPQQPPKQARTKSKVEAKTPPAPPSPPSSGEVGPAIDASATVSELSVPVLTPVQIVESPVAVPVAASSQPVGQPSQPHVHAVHAEKEVPAAPLQTQPELSHASAHPVFAQVVPITQPSAQEAQFSGVSPELLSRIARLAQLAQSDPEALKALVVLSAQLATQYTAATSKSAATPARAAAT
jgi:twitching motility two-component system response regulator PilH